MNGKNIYQRVAEVMQKVAYIQKDKAVETYMAVTHDMVTAMVRPHFLEAGIALHPTLTSATTEQTGKTTSKGTPYIRYSGSYDIAFVNVDEPSDRIVVHIEAHAEDTGDKAPGKAISYATKYAILKVLMIETGENDEGRVKVSGMPEDACQQWLDDIKAAESIDSVRAVKDEAFKAAKSANDLDAHRMFKEAVLARLRELDPKAAAKAAA